MQSQDKQPRNEAGKSGERASGTAGPCILCPLNSPSAKLEEHHVVGRNNDPELTAPLCPMHHNEQHEQLRESGASMRPANNPLDWIISKLRALGTFLYSLAQACFRWVDVLIGFRDDLDNHCPAWRDLTKPA
jgi:hypothetical protein